MRDALRRGLRGGGGRGRGQPDTGLTLRRPPSVTDDRKENGPLNLRGPLVRSRRRLRSRLHLVSIDGEGHRPQCRVCPSHGLSYDAAQLAEVDGFRQERLAGVFQEPLDLLFLDPSGHEHHS